MGASRPAASPKAFLLGKIDQTPSDQLPSQIRDPIKQKVFDGRNSADHARRIEGEN